jgi:hypothetical protein
VSFIFFLPLVIKSAIGEGQSVSIIDAKGLLAGGFNAGIGFARAD